MEIPHRERLPSQVFAEWGKKWVALNDAASLLEENRKTFFAELKNKYVEQQATSGKKVNKSDAEDEVYRDPKYIEYVQQMIKARTAANEARIAMKYAEIRAQERNSEEAQARQEWRMTRSSG